LKKIYESEQVTVFQSVLYKTNCTVIQTDDCVLLVDPNWLPFEIECIRNFITQIKGKRPLYLLFTHSDYDHIIGYGAFSDAITIGSSEMNTLPNKEDIIEQIIRFDHDYYIDREYEIAFPKLNHVISEEGEQLKIGQTTLTFFKAPGHTSDGLFTIVEPLGIFIAGDYLSDIEFPYIYSSGTDYDHTLQKVEGILKQHPITLLVPGHGHTTNSPAEIRLRQQQSLTYIQQLKKEVTKGTAAENTLYLIESYKYLKNMTNFHHNNIKLLKNEWNKKV